MAEEAALAFGLEVETTAEDALVRALARSYGVVLFYRAQVAKLQPDQMVQGATQITRTRKLPGGPDETVEEIVTAKTTVNVWVRLLAEAEKHHLEVARTIAGLGIEARRLQLAEAEGALWHELVIRTLARFGIPDDDPRLPVVVGEVIAELSA